MRKARRGNLGIGRMEYYDFIVIVGCWQRGEEGNDDRDFMTILFCFFLFIFMRLCYEILCAYFYTILYDYFRCFYGIFYIFYATILWTFEELIFMYFL